VQAGESCCLHDSLSDIICLQDSGILEFAECVSLNIKATGLPQEDETLFCEGVWLRQLEALRACMPSGLLY
jgi:hypothetical protein